MQSFKLAALAMAVSAGVVISGCGGGSSSSSGGTPSGDRTITAIDGYLANAEVYIDANQNGVLDAGDKSLPAGVTDENGNLTVPGATFSGSLLVHAVSGKTIDSDSGVVTDEFTLSAPAGSQYITPFTHLVQVTGDSVSDLAKKLGLDEPLITGDYIKAKISGSEADQGKAKVAHALARFIVAETKKKTDEAIISSVLLDAKTEIERQIVEGKDADIVELELMQDGSIDTAPPTKLGFIADDLAGTSWSMFSVDDAGDNEQFFIRFGSTNQPDAFCMSNEKLSFLTEEAIKPQTAENCSAIDSYSVDADGTLALTRIDGGKQSISKLTMLYRHSETDYSMFLMVANNGALFWVDNNPSIRDAGDYLVSEDVTVYSFRDDAPARNEFKYDSIMSSFEITGNKEYQVSGKTKPLNLGDLKMSTLAQDKSVTTTFEVKPLYVEMGWQSTSDDVVVAVENASGDSEEHWYLPYRKAGALTLVWDYKPDAVREVVFVQSESRALVELISSQVEKRKSGTQVTN